MPQAIWRYVRVVYPFGFRTAVWLGLQLTFRYTMIGGKYWHDADFTYKLLNFGNYLLHHYSTNCGQKHIILKEISWNITYQKDSLFSQRQSKLCWFFWGYSGWNWNYSFIIWRVRVIWTNLKMHFTLWGVIFTIGELWSWTLYILEKRIF